MDSVSGRVELHVLSFAATGCATQRHKSAPAQRYHIACTRQYIMNDTRTLNPPYDVFLKCTSVLAVRTKSKSQANILPSTRNGAAPLRCAEAKTANSMPSQMFAAIVEPRSEFSFSKSYHVGIFPRCTDLYSVHVNLQNIPFMEKKLTKHLTFEWHTNKNNRSDNTLTGCSRPDG